MGGYLMGRAICNKSIAREEMGEVHWRVNLERDGRGCLPEVKSVLYKRLCAGPLMSGVVCVCVCVCICVALGIVDIWERESGTFLADGR